MATDSLRNQLIEHLKRSRSITLPAVESAFRKVPRHEFLPGLTLEQVYRDDAIVTRWTDGLPSSSSSQPAVMAIMAEQLELRVGHAVLEIGAGTGYNAAILRELVGPAGRVVSVEIQPDVAEEARRNLERAGYGDVSVVTGDGGFGHPEGAPYDRIILTASASDISPRWVEQLREGGLLLIPFRFSTMCLCVAFEKHGRELFSRSLTSCGFMPLQGVYGPDATGDDPRFPMDDGLFVSGPGSRGVSVTLLEELLNQTPRRVSDLIIPVNDFGLGGGLGTYLALTESGLVDIFATQPERWGFHYISGLLDAETKSLCLVRHGAVVVYGSDAAAERYKRRASEWIEMGRPGIDSIRIAVAPREMEQPGMWMLRRKHYNFAISFQAASG
ncbi:MAG: methyltransferase domain-containing protein [bacterium]